MRLPFYNREQEAERIRRFVEREEGSFAVLYGRRRCGKSRLLREVVPVERSVFYVGDDREEPLQRESLAREMATRVEGFAKVHYGNWEALLDRWWTDAEPGTVLVLDELPALVAQSPELPSLLQKVLDQRSERGLHLLVAGSSQRMMQGLVLDRSAPLYGRATEILKIGPLGAGWIREALELDDAKDAVESYAAWGGVPRYWELARDHADLETALRRLVLDPLGVLHEEPTRLLLDDLRETTQAASILSLIGAGCHRVSEIAGRLGKPATSLQRPLSRLMEMGLVDREEPYGAPKRGNKKTLYRIADPFLRFWFRCIEPNRSRLEARQIEPVERDIATKWPHHVSSVWEELVRASIPHLDAHGGDWGVARRWWGPGLDRKPLEIDLVAESFDGERLLIGEVKWSEPEKADPLLRELERKVERLPFTQGREVTPMLWLAAPAEDLSDQHVSTPQSVLEHLLQ